MSGPVCYTATAVSLASFSILKTLTSKGPLVNLPILSAAEWHAEVLQLAKRHRNRYMICSFSCVLYYYDTGFFNSVIQKERTF